MPLYTGDKFGFGKSPDSGGGGAKPGEAFFPEPGQYDWVCPDGVTSVCAVCIGGGGGATRDEMGGAGGGGLGYKNSIAVIPGQTYKIQVGAGGVGDVYMGNYGASGGDSWFMSATTVKGGGGGGTGCGADGDHTVPGYGGRGGTFVGDSGGNGGNGGDGNRSSISGTGADTGGGGAGGYGGDGGLGGDYNGNWQSGTAGNGGAGGGGCTAAGGSNEYWGGGGGGVSVYGKGRNGGSGTGQNWDWNSGGVGGSGGAAGWGNGGNASGYGHVSGGQFGGGGGSTDQRGGYGASGAVRLIWGTGRSFPSNGADDFWSETITRYTAPTAEDPTTTSSNWFRGGLGEEDNGNYSSNYNYNGIVPNVSGHDNLDADFTIECWIYVERLVDNTLTFGSGTNGWGAVIMDGRRLQDSSDNQLGSWWISRGNSRRGSTGPYFMNYAIQGASNITSDTECIEQCTWHHVALTRQNNEYWMWVDGVKVLANGGAGGGGVGGTPTTLQAQSDRPVIGGWGYGGRMNYWSWYGNISNFRISKGIALYDGSGTDYTVPTFPLTTTLPGQGGGSVSSHSVNFNGTNHLSVGASSDMSMGTGDFTIECWARFDTGANVGLWQVEGLTTNYTTTLSFAHNGSNWHGYRGGSTWDYGGARTASQWYHTAYVRHSGTCTVYVDGTALGSWSDSYNYTGTTLVIGGYYTTGYRLNGNISNFRVVKGQALYTQNFTPTTEPLTTTSQGANSADVKLLCCNKNSATGKDVGPSISNSGGAAAQNSHPFGAAGPSVQCLCCGVDDDFEKDLVNARVWSGPNCMTSVLGPGKPTEEVVKKGYRIWGRHRGLGGGTKTGNNGDPGDGGLLSTWKKSTGSFQTEQFGTNGGWSATSGSADGVSIKVIPNGAYATGDNAGAKWNLRSISYGSPTNRPRNNSVGFGPFIENVQIRVIAGKDMGGTIIYDSQPFTLRLPSYNNWNSNAGTPSKERYTSCAFEIELPNGGANDLDMDTWYSVYLKGMAHPNVNDWNSTNGTPGANKQNFWYPESPVSYSSNSGSYNLMRYAPSTSGDTDDVEVRLENCTYGGGWATPTHGAFNPLGQWPFFGISMPINFMKDPIPTGGGGGGGGATYTTSGLIFNVDASESSSYGGSGNTWTDIAGSNNVTLTNCTYSSANGGGITFDGVSNWSIGEFTTPFTANQLHTWEVWTNGEWTTGWPGSQFTWILHNSANGQSTGSSYMTIGINDGNNFFGALDGRYGSMANTTYNSTNSTVYHLMLTWDGATQKFYVNGSLSASYSTPAYGSWQNSSSYSTTTTMGEAIGGNYRPLKGNIYSVRCWDRALSAAEVSSNFAGNKTKFGYPSTDISGGSLVHYWNATSANVSGTTITDEMGTGNNLTSQWGSISHSSTRGGEASVPSNTANGYFSFGSDVTFGSGGQAFTFFWCGEKSQSPWWMLATGSDGNNFIGYDGSTLRLDSNQDVKGDLSYSGMDMNTLYCVYMTMASNGAMSWYVNGNHVGNNNYGGTWSNHNVIFDSLNHYDSGGSYQTAGKFYFAGFYSKALTSSEVSSNWTAHQTRLGI